MKVQAASTILIVLQVSILFLFHLIPGFYCDNKNEDDGSKYSKKELEALTKLRELVKDELYADYMHKNEYLSPWLRNRNLDVNKAADFIRANLKWRKDENMDNALDEVFPQFEKEYRWDLKAKDKEGRPVILIPLSSWDIRKAALAGQMKQLIRYFIINTFERPQVLARQETEKGIIGTNSSQFVIIVDLGGYNLKQHACTRCMEFYLTVAIYYEAHYPQAATHTIAINNPKIFDPVVEMTKPFYSEYLSQTLKLLGPDRKKWRSYLDKIVDLKQMPKRFGGSSTRPI